MRNCPVSLFKSSIQILVLIIILYSMKHVHGSYGRNGLLIEGLKFSKPCPEEGYRYHSLTGNFLCVVETARQCVSLCEKFGCTEWIFQGQPANDDQVNPYKRCRCVPRYNFCFYNHVPLKYRNFT